MREHLFNLLRPRRFQRLEVLRDVSFSVEPGETVGLMGRNGSGKSTLLKILCGIYRADRGRVTWRASVTPLLELGIGFNPELSAVDNILLLGTVMGMSLRQAKAATDAILAFAEIERFANLKVKHFSSGMASRLAYSVAFSAVREVLVLDEIFAVGDAGFREKCERRYRELSAAGHTILMVSHSPSIVAEFCSRALLLDDGHIVQAGGSAEVAQAYQRTAAGG